jgi:hypothetical protein
MKKNLVFAVMIAMVFIMAGCASMPLYKQLDTLITSGDYAGANGLVEKEKNQYADENELLYYFDKGSLLQFMGKYDDSSSFLDKAQDKIESLYTKSITKEAVSYLVNDLKLPYQGEDFEQVWVSGLKALDSMYQGKYDDALIAVRKADHVMNLISDNNEGKNIYKEDAFIRYLSAFAYEAKGELSDAYIDYKKSENLYEQDQTLYGVEMPEIVKRDILRVASGLNYKSDIEEFENRWGNISFNDYKTMIKYGEVLLIIYDGLAPYKVSKSSTVIVYENEIEKTGPATITVAFPHYVERGYTLVSAEALVGQSKYRSYVGDDISKIAVNTLESKNGIIAVKEIARAAAKYFAGKAIRDKANNEIVDLITNDYSYASEEADTRSWHTLPARFHFIRIPLTPGRNTINVALYNAQGIPSEKVIDVNIRAGEKKVVPVFVFN